MHKNIFFVTMIYSSSVSGVIYCPVCLSLILFFFLCLDWIVFYDFPGILINIYAQAIIYRILYEWLFHMKFIKRTYGEFH